MKEKDCNKKSTYGLGHVRQRKDGSFEGILYDKRIGRTVSVSAKTQTELNKRMKEKRKEILTQEFGKITNMKVEDYFLYWLQTFMATTVKCTTYDKHEQVIRNHVIPRIGYLKMKEVTSADLQKMFNDLSKIRAYSTIKKVMEVVRPCFKHAALTGDIIKNPMLGVKMPSKESVVVQTKDIEIYSDDDLKRMEETYLSLYEEKHLYRLSPMYLFLAHTGMRRGELLALKWKDINFKNNTAKIRYSLARYKKRDENMQYIGGYETKMMNPKTRTSNRTVYLNTKAVSYLQEMKRRNDALGIKSEYVVCNKDGVYVHSRSFDQELDRWCKRIGIEFKGLHALRHSFATRAIAAGVPIKVVSELLGHADIKITLNTYTHVLESQKYQAVELLEAL